MKEILRDFLCSLPLFVKLYLLTLVLAAFFCAFCLDGQGLGSGRRNVLGGGVIVVNPGLRGTFFIKVLRDCFMRSLCFVSFCGFLSLCLVFPICGWCYCGLLPLSCWCVSFSINH